ncbi:MAG: helix-turn-helix domain-containing protein [Candidatus Levybacteria bacterium]|nr:helix-turn-helix domain-containing protein [Candidatus Levybacteria bacterium]
METTLIEATYPLSFHKTEDDVLGKHLKNRHNVVLIGMKRVGISDFLRFFLYRPEIVDTYIGDGKKHIFIPVDLNDLVERELRPFWILTLKRLADTVSTSITATDEVKKKMEALFSESIQTQDTFLTIDNIRKSLLLLTQNGYMPTLFFLRFDRIKDVATPEFFSNLEGIKTATQGQVSFVFTSYRNLDMLSPHAFPKASLQSFAHTMYLRPVTYDDGLVIYKTYTTKYDLYISDALQKALFALVDGYVQYLHLALILLHEKKDSLPATKEALEELLLKDERIYLQSEELWESLTTDEQAVLKKVQKGEVLSEGEKVLGKYLWDSGFVDPSASSGQVIFSPLFAHYVTQKDKKVMEAGSTEFTKKEQKLFTLLKEHLNEICEREKIIEGVWAEVEELGVSDWAIDRLVARVRSKLKMQKSGFEIQTIKTRGYKLISLAV